MSTPEIASDYFEQVCEKLWNGLPHPDGFLPDWKELSDAQKEQVRAQVLTVLDDLESTATLTGYIGGTHFIRAIKATG